MVNGGRVADLGYNKELPDCAVTVFADKTKRIYKMIFLIITNFDKAKRNLYNNALIKFGQWSIVNGEWSIIQY